jgi:hypothetical protein
VSQSAHQAELRKEADDAAEAERTRALLDEEKKAHERAARKARCTACALWSTLMRVAVLPQPKYQRRALACTYAV